MHTHLTTRDNLHMNLIFIYIINYIYKYYSFSQFHNVCPKFNCNIVIIVITQRKTQHNYLIMCILQEMAIISIITIISIKNMHAYKYKCSNSDYTITTKSVMQTTNLTN